MTPITPPGSRFFLLLLTPVVSIGCGARGEADPALVRPLPASRLSGDRAADRPANAGAVEPEAPSAPTPPPVRGETCLGVTDRGIWSDLDEKIQLALPARLAPEQVSARIDRARV